MKSYKDKNYKNKGKGSRFIYLFILLVALVLIFLALELNGKTNFFSNDTDNKTISDDGINLDPPTEEELQETENYKQQLVEEQKQSQNEPVSSPAGEKTAVKPVIGYIEVRDNSIRANGFITTMIEEGGTCTLTLKNGDKSVQTTSSSLADAQSTICGLMQINRNETNNGEWIATLSYSSNKYVGVSDEQMVRID